MPLYYSVLLCLLVFALWAFEQDGSIVLNNERIRKSCEIYGLNRQILCDERRKLWTDLVDEIADCVIRANGNVAKLKDLLQSHLDSFKRKADDETNTYLAFRH